MIGDGDMKHVGPGLYLDEKNRLHVDVPELLAEFGYADTPENRDILTAQAKRAFHELYPTVPIHEA